ncbi:hypothetical protein M5K25_015818 [Dendrobium thyrsiflorum]|uniref:ATP synthase subunit epsilon, mitochondrial n=1 Tax=Dendrobium thyrsiflorum TaxID=117978 RepID=A0ABD0URT5_DENTH
MASAAASSSAAVPFWRAAGMTYITYSNICASLVRSCLKEPYKSEAASREKVHFAVTKWVSGKPEKSSKPSTCFSFSFHFLLTSRYLRDPVLRIYITAKKDFLVIGEVGKEDDCSVVRVLQDSTAGSQNLGIPKADGCRILVGGKPTSDNSWSNREGANAVFLSWGILDRWAAAIEFLPLRRFRVAWLAGTGLWERRNHLGAVHSCYSSQVATRTNQESILG